MDKKIIIVDDDELLRQSLSGILKTKGFEVRELADGDEVVDTLKSFNPDVILLDLMMQRVGGVECVKILAKENKDILSKIIVMTNSDSMDDISEVVSCGVTTYLNKNGESLDQIVQAVEAKIN